MFKKVVSLCLSAAVAMSLGVVAGAEHERIFLNDEECKTFCKDAADMDKVFKCNIAEIGKNNTRPYFVFFNKVSFDKESIQKVIDLINARRRLALYYILHCPAKENNCSNLANLSKNVDQTLKEEFIGKKYPNCTYTEDYEKVFQTFMKNEDNKFRILKKDNEL